MELKIINGQEFKIDDWLDPVRGPVRSVYTLAGSFNADALNVIEQSYGKPSRVIRHNTDITCLDYF